jgi:transcriptional regulator with XRE-family HTH domain
VAERDPVTEHRNPLVWQLQRALVERNVTELCDGTGAAERTARRVLRDPRANPTADTLAALAQALGKRWLLIDEDV